MRFCNETGRTGYKLNLQITFAVHECVVFAPSLIPKRASERVKTNRRHAVTPAKMHRAGELTSVWVPDRAHEAVRDLVRAREAAMHALKSAPATVAVVPLNTSSCSSRPWSVLWPV